MRVRVCIIKPERVKRDESRLSQPEQQIPELRFPISVKADNFAIENGTSRAHLGSYGLVQRGKRFELVSVAGDEPVPPMLNPNDGAVRLDFK